LDRMPCGKCRAPQVAHLNWPHGVKIPDERDPHSRISGDMHTLLLDKTGTITLGNRQPVVFLPLGGADERELADAAQLSSLADETPEGRSIVVLAKEKFQIRGREISDMSAMSIPFSAYTRMSGVDLGGRAFRKGAAEAIAAFATFQRKSCEQSVNNFAPNATQHRLLTRAKATKKCESRHLRYAVNRRVAGSNPA